MDDNGEHLQRDKQHKMVHNISVMDNSFLYNVFQAKQIQVNSIHHQAIKTL
jgi:gamma-glutamyl-gamma-aminobutyrate hydrolase PuuD